MTYEEYIAAAEENYVIKTAGSNYTWDNTYMEEIFNFFNKNICGPDCPCLLCPIVDKRNDTVVALKFQWNKKIYDENWNDDTVLPLNAIITDTEANVLITFTAPFSETFVINKDSVTKAEVLQNKFTTIVNALDNIHNAMVNKLLLLKAEHELTIADTEDYVDAVLNRVYESVQEEQQAFNDEAKFELGERLASSPKGLSVYRLKALKDIPAYKVRAGQELGYVESLDNLGPNGIVLDEAIVAGRSICDGVVKDSAIVMGAVKIDKKTVISGYASISGKMALNNAKISGKASLTGNISTAINSSLEVKDNAKLSGAVSIAGKVVIKNNSTIKCIGRKLIIEGGTFQDNTVIEASGYVKGSPIFKGRNYISGEIKLDCRLSPGNIFSDINSVGLFKAKSQQQLGEPLPEPLPEPEPEQEIVPEEPVPADDTDDVATISQDMEEEGEEMDKGKLQQAFTNRFSVYGVKNPSKWDGPLVKTSQLSEEEIEYIKSLDGVLMDAGADSPKYFETDIEDEAITIEFEGFAVFYALLKKDGTIEKMWKLDKNILK